MLGGSLNGANKPEIYKSYPSSKTIQLPSVLQEATMNLLRFFVDARDPSLLKSALEQS